MSNSVEARHPIGVVAERTGLTPDVLRVWERRYSAVRPDRSAGGHRLYSDADIERLTLLYRATRRGYGISRIVFLGTTELVNLVRDTKSLAANPAAIRFAPLVDPRTAIRKAVAFAGAFDPFGLESLFRSNVSQFGITAFLDGIAAPFLRAIGDAWHDGKLTISQGHIADAVVKRVVGELTPMLTAGPGNPTIVIGTLEGERHANGALMAAVTAANAGWRVMYLGSDLPAVEIGETAGRTRARAVGISIVLEKKKKRVISRLRELHEAMPPGATLLVGGAGSSVVRERLDGLGRVSFVETMSDLHSELSAIKARA